MEKTAGRYEMDMCSGSILKKMLLFTLPLMASSILQLLFNAADIVVVGRFAGINSLAAVGATTALINLLTNLFVGLSIGANVAAARSFGAKQETVLSRTVHTSVSLSLISGIALTAAGFFGAAKMLELMSTPEEIRPLAASYLRIYFLGMTSSMVYNFGSALLRAIGDTRRPLYYLLAAGALNVVMNLIFVIIFRMDVAGVALATVISQTLSAVLVLRCLMKEEGGIKFIPSKLKIHKAQLLVILKIGLPAGFQGIVFSLSNVVIQSSVNTFGKTVVAGNSAASNIEGFVYVAMNSFYQATLSFVSQNFGAGKYDRINKILIRGELCVAVVGIILGNLVCFFGAPLLSIYTESPAVIEAGLVRMGIICRTYALCGIMDVLVGALRGIGSSLMPMIVSILGVCVLRLAWIAVVFGIPEYHTIETVFYSYPITWTVTSLAHLLCFVILRRRIRAKFEKSPEGV